MNDLNKIKQRLPYTEPFLFVDELTELTETNAEGNYTFSEDSFFFKGHFKNHPVTPGAILTECMAQIGLVSLGLFILKDESLTGTKIALSSTEIDFYEGVYPNEKVTVSSEKIYFRFNKLKCKVRMHNIKGILVAKGIISGMIING